MIIRQETASSEGEERRTEMTWKRPAGSRKKRETILLGVAEATGEKSLDKEKAFIECVN